jgi:hypothetical protein
MKRLQQKIPYVVGDLSDITLSRRYSASGRDCAGPKSVIPITLGPKSANGAIEIKGLGLAILGGTIYG